MAWLWWIGAGLLLLVIETLTVDLTFLMLAVGAFGGAVAAAFDLPVWLQFVVCGAVSTLLLAGVRPWAKRLLLTSTPGTRTNAEGLVGRKAIATAVVDVHDGRVRLGGEEWSARLAEDTPPGARLEVGATARVVWIDGAVAVVEPR